MKTLKVKKLHPDAKLPEYKSAGAAGMDLASVEFAELYPGGIRLVKTGIAIEVPRNYEAQVRTRSSMALVGVSVVNSPGTIDADYRGEVGVVLQNHGYCEYVVRPGDRIAQLVVKPAPQLLVAEVDELSDTERGAGGYGSTGR